MLFPSTLRETIHQALAQLHQDTHHHLYQHIRYNIFDEIQRSIADNVNAHRFLANLFTTTVDFASPNISDYRDEGRILERLQTTTKRTLTHHISPEQASQVASEAHYHIGVMEEEIIGEENTAFVSYFYCCHAALTALHASLGISLFTQGGSAFDDIPEDMQEDNVWDASTAIALAYAGGTEITPPDIEKRKIFWEWWLTEALETAWNDTFTQRQEQV